MPRYFESHSESEAKRRRQRDGYQFEIGTTGVVSLLCALAVVCALFFSFGYTLGKHATPATITLAPNAAPVGAGVAGIKPNPSVLAPVPPARVQPPNPVALSEAEQNQTPASLQSPPAGSAASSDATPPTPLVPAPAPSAQAASGSVPTAPAAVNEGVQNYSVQVFAGINQADALNLAAALKARQYPVYVVQPVPGSTDQFYRVQVGPYATPDEAETMRSRLAADGYNAIIKH